MRQLYSCCQYEDKNILFVESLFVFDKTFGQYDILFPIALYNVVFWC